MRPALFQKLREPHVVGYGIGFALIAGHSLGDYFFGVLDAQELLLKIVSAMVPLAVVFTTLLLFEKLPIPAWLRAASTYAIFFSVAFLTLTGQMGTLNGLAATSKSLWLYGFSFYTASLAYQLSNRARNHFVANALATANPLLLLSGPINTWCLDVGHWGFKRRADYFFPYVLAGVFFLVVVGAGIQPLLQVRTLHNIAPFLMFGIFLELYIYFNFAGLSLLVFGLLGIGGLKVPLNFRQPFSSGNLIEFWRGWHISLSAVLKALFYSPTRKRFGAFGAILATFMGSALWHGATLNFILWGFLHAIAFYLTLLLLRRNQKYAASLLLWPVLILARAVFGTPEFSDLVTSIWALDPFGGIDEVVDFMKTASLSSWISLTIGVLLVGFEILLRRHTLGVGRNYKYLRTPGALVILAIGSLLLASGALGEISAAYAQR